MTWTRTSNAWLDANAPAATRRRLIPSPFAGWELDYPILLWPAMKIMRHSLSDILASASGLLASLERFLYVYPHGGCTPGGGNMATILIDIAPHHLRDLICGSHAGNPAD